jgi:hypothetical protein
MRAPPCVFHHRLCQIRVLDPACGSANFLYVTLEHMKRLEGEVLDQIGASLGDTQGWLESEGLTVDPHQFLGLELNPRAAAVAELVLWIGYLQWHFRTRGNAMPPSPILKDFKNIECRDAVLAHDGVEYVPDATGLPVTRWDGRTFKAHPVTGEAVPDESAQTPLQRYLNPRKAEWPQADFIVGNPPFIGASAMRAALGDGYVDTLRGVWQDVPDSADFVMFWWQQAAGLVRAGKAQRFGFITTNSLRQTFNRRVVEQHLNPASALPLHLAYAIPDHPWVDSADGAAVRIAMTVGVAGAGEGRLLTVTAERETGGEGLAVELAERSGLIHADLSIGANVAAAKALRANGGISSPGFKLHGAGFIVTPEEVANLETDAPIKPYRNGRDLTDRPRGVMLIDLFGLTADEVRARYPAVFQWRAGAGEAGAGCHKDIPSDGAGYAKFWWLFGKPRQELTPATRRPAALHRHCRNRQASAVPVSRRLHRAGQHADLHRASTTPTPWACCPAACMSSGHWRRAVRLGGNDPRATTNPAASRPSPSPKPLPKTRPVSPRWPNNSTPCANACWLNTPT